jgi:quercetin dioxygenase-like cupin family protein
MALQHAKPGRPVNLSLVGEAADKVALVKTGEFEAILLKLAGGETLPNHQVQGSISLQCLSGSAAIELDGSRQVLKPADWLFLEGGTPHALEGITDCSLLLTIFFARDSRS